MMKHLILTALILLTLAAGCNSGEEETRAEEEAAGAARALAAYQAAGEALSAGREVFFRPGPSEAAFLEAGSAHNLLGAPNGYFTNQDGISGYFQNYSRPFNFTWNGGTVFVRAFDGHTYQVLDGPGELTLKYAGDELLLQRYQGEYKEGLWQGHGEFWTRNGETGGHNYMYYQGLFEHDHMTGRGALTTYNYGGLGRAPVRYEGEILNGSPHGQGLATDLVTGEMIYKGLWLSGDRFSGGREAWKNRDEAAELHEIGRQHREVMMTDRLGLAGEINPEPGRGPLVVVFPESFGSITVTDQTGRDYPVTTPPDQPPSAALELPPEAYPLRLTISYDRPKGTRHFLGLTVKRPFRMILDVLPAEPNRGNAPPYP